MNRYHMGRKKTGDSEETEPLLLRPRKTLVKRLETAAEEARRFINRNQLALEILERYLPLWEQLERQHEAAVEAQFKGVNDGGGSVQAKQEPKPVKIPVRKTYEIGKKTAKKSSKAS